MSGGPGVIRVHRAQVRHNELTKALSDQSGQAVGALEAVGALVGDRVKVVEERLGAVLDRSGH